MDVSPILELRGKRVKVVFSPNKKRGFAKYILPFLCSSLVKFAEGEVLGSISLTYISTFFYGFLNISPLRNCTTNVKSSPI